MKLRFSAKLARYLCLAVGLSLYLQSSYAKAQHLTITYCNNTTHDVSYSGPLAYGGKWDVVGWGNPGVMSPGTCSISYTPHDEWNQGMVLFGHETRIGQDPMNWIKASVDDYIYIITNDTNGLILRQEDWLRTYSDPMNWIYLDTTTGNVVLTVYEAGGKDHIYVGNETPEIGAGVTFPGRVDPENINYWVYKNMRELDTVSMPTAQHDFTINLSLKDGLAPNQIIKYSVFDNNSKQYIKNLKNVIIDRSNTEIKIPGNSLSFGPTIVCTTVHYNLNAPDYLCRDGENPVRITKSEPIEVSHFLDFAGIPRKQKIDLTLLITGLIYQNGISAGGATKMVKFRITSDDILGGAGSNTHPISRNVIDEAHIPVIRNSVTIQYPYFLYNKHDLPTYSISIPKSEMRQTQFGDMLYYYHITDNRSLSDSVFIHEFSYPYKLDINSVIGIVLHENSNNFDAAEIPYTEEKMSYSGLCTTSNCSIKQ